ncbi:MAG TPA: EamA family transporter [Chloroflexi bacterium]|nr:EamA family transporter [Chloroflexota bacterium]
MLEGRNLWILFALLSAFFAALTTILAKLGVQGVSSNVATAVRTVVILAIAWGWIAVTGEISSLRTISTTVLVFLVLSGVATGLSWLFYFRALQSGPTAVVAAIDKSSLVLVLLLSALILHEPLTWKTSIGIVLVVAGVLVTTL